MIKEDPKNTETIPPIIPRPVSLKTTKDSVTLQRFSHILLYPEIPETRFIADEIKKLLLPVIDIEIDPSVNKGEGERKSVV